MKSFDEFLSTITDAEWDDMLQKSREAVSSRKTTDPTTDFHDLLLIQNVMLLRRYHEWLSSQFD